MSTSRFVLGNKSDTLINTVPISVLCISMNTCITNIIAYSIFNKERES